MSDDFITHEFDRDRDILAAAEAGDGLDGLSLLDVQDMAAAIESDQTINEK